MILDALAEVPVETAPTADSYLDLDAVRPGPGEPIVLWASGVGGALDIQHSVTGSGAPAGSIITVDASEDMEFRLPSNVGRYIQANAAAGAVYVTLEGNQTNT